MIRFELNGKKVSTDADPSRRLIDVLRGEFNLTGPKEGCGEGECGACAVLADGILLNSCITPLGNAAGRKILTVEGIRDTEKYRLLEKCFAEAGAVQCGFCTPGMIMAAEALLLKNPAPSEEDIREAISGNLCRCTGYNMIIEAVKAAAEGGKNLWQDSTPEQKKKP